MKGVKEREAICRLGHQLYTRSLVHGSSGNISVRLESTWLMTPTGSCLGDLDPAKLAEIDSNGRLLSGDPPTKEAFLHACVYDVRPRAKAVLHTHSTHSVAVSCLNHEHGQPVIPPLTPYFVMRVGELALVPYYAPGDYKLAGAVKEVAAKHAIVLLANHGPVIASSGLSEALYALEELEETAKLHFLLRGLPARPLSEEQVAALLDRFPN